MEGEEEARPDDTGEDEGDSGDEWGAGPVQKPRQKRRKKTFIEPDSDDDPDPPPVYQEDHAPHEGGLTRTLEDVNIRNFKEKRPSGPTFKKKKVPITYFLKFFPLSLSFRGWLLGPM